MRVEPTADGGKTLDVKVIPSMFKKKGLQKIEKGNRLSGI